MAGKATRTGQRKDVKAKGKGEQRETRSEKQICSRTDLRAGEEVGEEGMRHVANL